MVTAKCPNCGLWHKTPPQKKDSECQLCRYNSNPDLAAEMDAAGFSPANFEEESKKLDPNILENTGGGSKFEAPKRRGRPPRDPNKQHPWRKYQKATEPKKHDEPEPKKITDEKGDWKTIVINAGSVTITIQKQ